MMHKLEDQAKAKQLQQTKSLLVVGDVQTVAFFRLVGATGFVVSEDGSHHLQPVLQYLRENAKSIGGIVVSPACADQLIERIDRMKVIEVPVIRLPDPSGLSQIGFLEALMEKAVGMKMEKKQTI